MSAEDEAAADAWKHAGLCRTPAANGVEFFPGRGESTKPAKDVCAQCPVRSECLEYALANSEKWGVWGGLSERERRAIRSTRAARQRPPVVCGTSAGANRHRRAGEPMCEPCREALNAYQRNYRKQAS